jgi:hypothetical protein
VVVSAFDNHCQLPALTLRRRWSVGLRRRPESLAIARLPTFTPRRPIISPTPTSARWALGITEATATLGPVRRTEGFTFRGTRDPAGAPTLAECTHQRGELVTIELPVLVVVELSEESRRLIRPLPRRTRPVTAFFARSVGTRRALAVADLKRRSISRWGPIAATSALASTAAFAHRSFAIALARRSGFARAVAHDASQRAQEVASPVEFLTQELAVAVGVELPHGFARRRRYCGGRIIYRGRRVLSPSAGGQSEPHGSPAAERFA